MSREIDSRRTPLVGTGEAAAAVQIARTTLARWVTEGRIQPAMRTIGGHLRWDVDDLRRQLTALGAGDYRSADDG